jgi:hypothetical protein
VRRVSGVVLEGEDLALAAVLVRIGAAHLQRVNGAVPPAALCLRDQLAAFALETASVLVDDLPETAKPAAAVIVADSPARIGTDAAAAQLQVSTQAVCSMCRRGELLASQSPAGHWQIDPGSVAALAARRKGI